MTTSNEPQRDFASQLCYKWEVEAFQAMLYDMRVACLRMGIVLSNTGGYLQRLLPVFKLGMGGPMGSGKQWMPWIHIQDVVMLIDFVLEKRSAAGAFNLCSPEPVTNKQFARALGKALTRPALVPTPLWALEPRFGKELMQMILSSQRAMPQRALEAGYQFAFTHLDEALKDLLSH